MHATSNTFMSDQVHIKVVAVIITQQRTHVHDDPEWRALTEPRYSVRSSFRSTCPVRLTHHACAKNKTHVRHAVAAPELGSDAIRNAPVVVAQIAQHKIVFQCMGKTRLSSRS
jgi:hypothetical protein